jgi:hypothetical protein
VNAQAPPALLDVWLAPQATSDLTNAAIRIRTGHVELLLRFPDALPHADRASILSQLEATIAKRRAFYLAQDADRVPTQRVGDVDLFDRTCER